MTGPRPARMHWTSREFILPGGMLSSHLGRNGQPMLEGFPLVTRFTIPFSDIDMLQHVNNLAYIRWCETVRTEYFATVMRSDITSERGMIQANINFTYERQLKFRESIAVGVRVSRLGTKSLDFSYEIWSERRAIVRLTASPPWLRTISSTTARSKSRRSGANGSMRPSGARNARSSRA